MTSQRLPNIAARRPAGVPCRGKSSDCVCAPSYTGSECCLLCVRHVGDVTQCSHFQMLVKAVIA